MLSDLLWFEVNLWLIFTGCLLVSDTHLFLLLALSPHFRDEKSEALRSYYIYPEYTQALRSRIKISN